MSRILVVDDEPTVLSFMATLLRRDGYDVDTANGGEEAMELLAGNQFNLMITDFMMSPIDGIELIKHANEAYPSMPTVMISGFCTVENAIEVLKVGAFDYLPKPVKIQDLRDVVGRAISYQSSLERQRAHKPKTQFDVVVAESPAMQKVCKTIERLLPTRTHSLVLGPPGTGKELVAHTVHDRGVARDGPFIKVDCSQRPESDLEKELFGLKTPDTEPSGAFRAAVGGTLYLSEIGSLPLALQERLDRILSVDSSQHSASSKSAANVQICAGSQDPLETMARKGNFCESLCQRLRPFSMVLPPLRERPEDVLGLTYYHLERYGQAEIDEPCLDAEAQLVIENYPWPGNVTELLEVVSEARRRSGQRQITVEHLPERIVAHVNVESLKKRRQLELAEYKGKALKSFLRDKERDYLKSVMDSVGNREEAAKKLRLDAAGLERHISGSGTR